jgi:hypothetical protein
MSALVRITTGIMPQHSRVGVSRAMSQFGEVIHCHKPPYSGIPGEDFVNVRFSTQEAADRAYEALKNGQCFIDGFQVGVGAAPKALGSDARYAIANGKMAEPTNRPMKSPSPPRRYARGVGRDPGANRGRSPPRRRSPPRSDKFPSRGDPKSPSPRRYARDMNMKTRDKSRSRSRQRDRDRWENQQSGRGRDRSRTPSPDPPGPVRNSTLVKNPFYRSNHSPDRV